MKETKFRVWDKQKSKMIYCGETIGCFNEKLQKHYKQNLMITMSGEIRIVQHYDNGITMHPYHDLELMGLVGLKDKNGTEIYEGDVIEWDKQFKYADCSNCNESIDEDNKYCPHCGEENTAEYKPKIVRVKWQSNRWNYADGSIAHGINEAMRKRSKVIGNIYENPELLKKETS